MTMTPSRCPRTVLRRSRALRLWSAFILGTVYTSRGGGGPAPHHDQRDRPRGLGPVEVIAVAVDPVHHRQEVSVVGVAWWKDPRLHLHAPAGDLQLDPRIRPDVVEI